jgi:hypothetical protein
MLPKPSVAGALCGSEQTFRHSDPCLCNVQMFFVCLEGREGDLGAEWEPQGANSSLSPMVIISYFALRVG